MAKKKDLDALERKNTALLKMLNAERQTVAGYKEAEKIQNAFMAVLLNKLGATDSDKTVAINRAEITKALEKSDVRVTVKPEADGWEFYCHTK